MNRRALRALAAVCDTFAPGDDALPPASALDVAGALAAVVDRSPRGLERAALTAALQALDALPAGTGRGRRARFAALPHAERERVLHALRDSRVPARRALYAALRRGALALYATVPAPHGAASPVWEAIGYPGPPGRLAAAPSPALAPLRVREDARLDCDCVVVGSGAGGGVVAAVLAAAGLDVVVLEAGPYLDAADFDGAEHAGLERLYLEGGALATDDQGVLVLAGACVGGGTTINYTTALEPPAAVLDEWARLGVPAFASPAYAASAQAVSARLAVNDAHGRASGRDEVLERGLRALGWHCAAMPRNVQGCDQGEVCGYCPYGCRLGAKQSTTRTFLADAQAAGARLLAEARVERIATRQGRAAGVVARTSDGRRIEVRSRAVAVAGGAIGTPVLLRRSGLGNERVGRDLRLQPVAAVFGIFDDVVAPWTGAMQARYSDEHADLGDGYGVKYETAAVHPGLVGALAPWRDAASFAVLLRALPHIVGVGAIVRDRDGGEVRVTRAGAPVLRYRLSAHDRASARRGVDGAAAILEAAGAHTIATCHATAPSYRPGRDGDRARLHQDADRCGFEAGRHGYVSFHALGSARLGGRPETSAADPEGELWGVRGVHVCDAAALPSAPGVNPMLAIAATAHLTASALAARLT